ncbi:hypothetical protein C7416_104480 [Cupriavidus phytorum]|uniref:Uncharacterized protein n=1 Tax=Cupriavidus phytorum TaxID=3024399 RepID=A0A2W7PS83_9BURK|nr:hypothetical protein [Cupriavidus alkaliphilus]PZX29475.1 hypothetical protein C7416_104480 [Cupriavidus alkaliphilus]
MAEIDPLAFQKGFQATQNAFDSARQNRLQDLLFSEKQREIGQANALDSLYRGAVGADGTIDRAKLLTGAASAGLGSRIPAMQTQFAAQDKAQIETRKAQLEAGLKQFEAMGQLMGGVTDQASYDLARQQAAGILGPEAAAKIPAVYDPEAIKRNVMQAMTVKDRMEQEYKRLTFGETQRHNLATEANTVRGQEMTAATARRGQDLTDARSREANALQGDLKQLQLQEKQEKLQEKDNAKKAAIANAEDALSVVDKAIKHPGREAASGVSGTLDPRNYVPGTDAKNFRVVLDQIKGQAFMQAYQNLRGGGQITEVEGKKATDAIARLDTAQSDAEFLTALNDLRGVMNAGYKRLTGKDYGAPTGTQTPAASGAPKDGATSKSKSGKPIVFRNGQWEYQ